MSSKKLFELNEMLKYCGYVEVTYMDGGKMSDYIRCESVEEVESLISIHGEVWF